MSSLNDKGNHQLHDYWDVNVSFLKVVGSNLHIYYNILLFQIKSIVCGKSVQSLS